MMGISVSPPSSPVRTPFKGGSHEKASKHPRPVTRQTMGKCTSGPGLTATERSHFEKEQKY